VTARGLRAVSPVLAPIVPVTDWQIITGEYPPQPGGVSDYTRLVAHGLADAGDRVAVWAPPCPDEDETHIGVTVHRLPDCFGARTRQVLTTHLDSVTPRARVLIQYVPQAFGRRGANVPFCWWVRSRRHDSVWVMFHEVWYPFDRRAGLRRNALAAANRLMASLVARAAERTFTSIPAWQADVASLAKPNVPVTWMPVPSGIAVVCDRAAAAEVRARVGRSGRPLVGHFGTYGGHIRPLVDTAVIALVNQRDCDVLLIGRGSEEARSDLTARQPQLAGRVHASGALDSPAVSAHITACDVMLQPYPDGVSTRRTSAMAALAHGRALVTTNGRLTEPVWNETRAALLVPVGDQSAIASAAAALVSNPAAREELARRGRAVYDARFDVQHTIEALRRT
jgi:glycosyltransferase involved in cell wall biosynthesis